MISYSESGSGKKSRIRIRNTDNDDKIEMDKLTVSVEHFEGEEKMLPLITV